MPITEIGEEKRVDYSPFKARKSPPIVIAQSSFDLRDYDISGSTGENGTREIVHAQCTWFNVNWSKTYKTRGIFRDPSGKEIFSMRYDFSPGEFSWATLYMYVGLFTHEIWAPGIYTASFEGGYVGEGWNILTTKEFYVTGDPPEDLEGDLRIREFLEPAVFRNYDVPFTVSLQNWGDRDRFRVEYLLLTPGGGLISYIGKEYIIEAAETVEFTEKVHMPADYLENSCICAVGCFFSNPAGGWTQSDNRSLTVLVEGRILGDLRIQEFRASSDSGKVLIECKAKNEGGGDSCKCVLSLADVDGKILEEREYPEYLLEGYILSCQYEFNVPAGLMEVIAGATTYHE